MFFATKSQLSEEDRRLVQTLGIMLRQIIEGRTVTPLDTNRIDELGILASLVNRAANEILLSRERERRQRAELERALVEITAANEHQQQLLETIRELSTPVLSITDSAVLMPLVGAVDSARSRMMMDALLQAVSARRARYAILDITGVPVVDTQVASVLLQAAQAASLLGARVLLCGINPEVAQVIISLGIDMSAAAITNNLQSALQIVLAEEGLAPSARGSAALYG